MLLEEGNLVLGKSVQDCGKYLFICIWLWQPTGALEANPGFVRANTVEPKALRFRCDISTVVQKKTELPIALPDNFSINRFAHELELCLRSIQEVEASKKGK